MDSVPHLCLTMEALKCLGGDAPLLKKCADLFVARSRTIYRVVALVKVKGAYDEARATLKIVHLFHSDLHVPGEKAAGPLLVAQVRAALGKAIVPQAGGARLLGPAPCFDLESLAQARLGKTR